MSALAIVVGLWGHSCLPHLGACGEDVKQADFYGVYAVENCETASAALTEKAQHLALKGESVMFYCRPESKPER